MAKAKQSYRPGDAIYVPVAAEHIMDSDPCNKDHCMLTRAFAAHLSELYGDRKFKIKSTNHGAIFELNGRKYVAVFDTKTAFRIYRYDQTYRSTRSKEKARSTVRPFKSRVMIESSTAATKWPAMTAETKAKLRALPKKREHEPKITGSRRELSL